MTVRYALTVMVCALSLYSAFAVAEENPADSLLPDFYNDPTLSTSGIKLDDFESSSIDYFSGMMSRSATDFSLPGNGGLPMTFSRTYRSQQPYAMTERTTSGVGWNMNFGWVEITDINKMCSPLWAVSVMDNPVLHMPDGSVDVLAMTDVPMGDATRVHYRGKGGMGIVCGAVLGGDNTAPFLLVGPDGTRYELEMWSAGGDMVGFYKTAKWFVKKITDRHGNWIWIDYANVGYESERFPAPVRVTASDGRDVFLEYGDESRAEAQGMLQRIVYGGAPVVEYEYVPSGSGDGFFDLIQVTLREELVWRYEYSAKADPGAGSMTKAINPFGGTTSYTWTRVYFQNGDTGEMNASVAQVVHDSTSSPAAIWTYTYTAATAATNRRDITTVTAPEGIYQYTHFSASAMVSGEVWKVGLKERVVFTPNSGGGSVRADEYTWEPYYISAENYKRTTATGLYAAVDQSYYGPLLASQKTTIDGSVWRTTSTDWWWSLESLGPPQAQTITMRGPDGAEKIVNRRYDHRESIFVYYLLHQEFLTQAEFPNNTPMSVDFDAVGNPVTRFDKGFYTFMAYDAQGNLLSSTHGQNLERTEGAARITLFSDYFMGVPRRTEHPDATITLRDVDAFGRTIAKTDRDGNTTRYAYDQLGRVLLIDYPLGNDTLLDYSIRTTRLVRGNYQRTTVVDGFGRDIRESHADAATRRSIQVTRDRDEQGRVTFTSYPNSVEGMRYGYDDYGRITRITHPGGQRAYRYLDGGYVEVTDENGSATRLFRDEIAGPGKGELVRIESPENIVTTIERNEYGLPLRIRQGNDSSMLERTNNYNASLVLLSSTNPETGFTGYGYDWSGNITLIDRQDVVGGPSLKQYNLHDANNRTITTWAPRTEVVLPTTGDKEIHDARLEFTYTPEGKPVDQTRFDSITQMDGAGDQIFSGFYSNTWRNAYDANGNLLSERMTVNGNVWQFDYAYDANDRLATLSYPGGEVVAYAPDAFGWATQAGRYATNVRYHDTGQLAGFRYGNGRQMNIGIDNRYLVASMNVPDISALAYDYDPAGNVIAIIDAVNPGENIALRYDGMNRLIGADGPWGVGTFAYDEVGNITQKNIGGDNLSLAYNARNRLTSVSGSRSHQFSHDAFGNISRRDGQEFIYDGTSSLRADRNTVGGNPGTYQYDARGRRLSTSRYGSGTQYSLYANNDQLLYETNPVEGTWQRNIHVGAMLVARSEEFIACYDDQDGDGIPHCTEIEAGLDPFDPLDAGGDRDNDGLTNIQEYQLGTGINDADTDDDGISDGVEVSWGLNPKVADADGDLDGDGLPNGVEVARGFDPSNPADGIADTDGDGLSNATEYALGTNWQNADSDGDGISDGVEVGAGLNPLAADADGDLDGDGLPNGWEALNGLSPTNAADAQLDHDGDGVTTLIEYQQGSNPFVADVLPPTDDVFVNTGGNMDFVSWVANPYAQSYAVDYGILGQPEQQSFSALGATHFEHTGVLADTVYWYSVRAKNAHGEVRGKRVVAMPGLHQQHSIPLSMPSVNAGRGSIKALVAKGGGDSIFVATYDDYLKFLHINAYRHGLVRSRDVYVDTCCWQLVASESGDALLVWASNTPQQVTYYTMRYSWANDDWGPAEQLAVLPSDGGGFVRAFADEHGNFRIAYTSNQRYANYYSNGYPKFVFTLYLASAYRDGAWSTRQLFKSGDAGIVDVKFGSATSILMKEYRHTVQSGFTVYFTPEYRLYLMREGASSWSNYQFATHPSILGVDFERNLLAYTVQDGSNSNVYAARVCGDNCLQGNTTALATIPTNTGNPGPLVFDGNGLGQVYWIDSDALMYSKGGTDRSGAFVWSRRPITLVPATQFSAQQLVLVRNRSTAYLLWGYEATSFTEINPDGSWKTPSVILSALGVRAADMDVAGNLAYVAEAYERHSVYERRRLSSAARYESGSVPPTLSQSSVRSGKSTIKHVVTLTADEPANLFFSVTGGTITSGGANTTAEQRYTGPLTITFPKGGSATISSRGINMAELWSKATTVVLQ